MSSSPSEDDDVDMVATSVADESSAQSGTGGGRGGGASSSVSALAASAAGSVRRNGKRKTRGRKSAKEEAEETGDSESERAEEEDDDEGDVHMRSSRRAGLRRRPRKRGRVAAADDDDDGDGDEEEQEAEGAGSTSTRPRRKRVLTRKARARAKKLADDDAFVPSEAEETSDEDEAEVVEEEEELPPPRAKRVSKRRKRGGAGRNTRVTRGRARKVQRRRGKLEADEDDEETDDNEEAANGRKLRPRARRPKYSDQLDLNAEEEDDDESFNDEEEESEASEYEPPPTKSAKRARMKQSAARETKTSSSDESEDDEDFALVSSDDEGAEDDDAAGALLAAPSAGSTKVEHVNRLKSLSVLRTRQGLTRSQACKHFLRHYYSSIQKFVKRPATVKKWLGGGGVELSPEWLAKGEWSAIDGEKWVDPIADIDKYVTNGQLRDYQRQGVRWMVESYARGVGCLLGDEMGLGKTIQTLSFFSFLYHKLGISGPHLVVVPTSVAHNWVREARKWVPMLSVSNLHGTMRQRDFALDKIEDNLPDILVTTYSTSKIELEFFKARRWRTLVLDEAHHVKNAKSSQSQAVASLRCHFKILLTGTPLQNDLQELGALLHFMLPGLKLDMDKFQKAYDLDQQSAQVDLIKASKRLLSAVMLRRLKQHATVDLPPKVRKRVKLPLTPLQNRWYKLMLTRHPFLQRVVTKNQMTKVFMQLRKICCHPMCLLSDSSDLIEEAHNSIATLAAPLTEEDVFNTRKNGINLSDSDGDASSTDMGGLSDSESDFATESGSSSAYEPDDVDEYDDEDASEGVEEEDGILASTYEPSSRSVMVDISQSPGATHAASGSVSGSESAPPTGPVSTWGEWRLLRQAGGSNTLHVTSTQPSMDCEALNEYLKYPCVPANAAAEMISDKERIASARGSRMPEDFDDAFNLLPIWGFRSDFLGTYREAAAIATKRGEPVLEFKPLCKSEDDDSSVGPDGIRRSIACSRYDNDRTVLHQAAALRRWRIKHGHADPDNRESWLPEDVLSFCLWDARITFNELCAWFERDDGDVELVRDLVIPRDSVRVMAKQAVRDTLEAEASATGADGDADGDAEAKPTVATSSVCEFVNLVELDSRVLAERFFHQLTHGGTQRLGAIEYGVMMEDIYRYMLTETPVTRRINFRQFYNELRRVLAIALVPLPALAPVNRDAVVRLRRQLKHVYEEAWNCYPASEHIPDAVLDAVLTLAAPKEFYVNVADVVAWFARQDVRENKRIKNIPTRLKLNTTHSRVDVHFMASHAVTLHTEPPATPFEMPYCTWEQRKVRDAVQIALIAVNSLSPTRKMPACIEELFIRRQKRSRISFMVFEEVVKRKMADVILPRRPRTAPTPEGALWKLAHMDPEHSIAFQTVIEARNPYALAAGAILTDSELSMLITLTQEGADDLLYMASTIPPLQSSVQLPAMTPDLLVPVILYVLKSWPTMTPLPIEHLLRLVTFSVGPARRVGWNALMEAFNSVRFMVPVPVIVEQPHQIDPQQAELSLDFLSTALFEIPAPLFEQGFQIAGKQAHEDLLDLLVARTAMSRRDIMVWMALRSGLQFVPVMSEQVEAEMAAFRAANEDMHKRARIFAEKWAVVHNKAADGTGAEAKVARRARAAARKKARAEERARLRQKRREKKAKKAAAKKAKAEAKAEAKAQALAEAKAAEAAAAAAKKAEAEAAAGTDSAVKAEEEEEQSVMTQEQFAAELKQLSTLRGEDLINASSKLILLDKLLRSIRPRNERVLIFSQFLSMLDILEYYMAFRGWPYKRLDGSTNLVIRELDVNEFNEPESPFFAYLISTRAGGVGINLASACHVVLYDSDWNPQVDRQAEDRAHRIGQTKPVHVYRLLMAETIEERMFVRARARIVLEDAVVTVQGGSDDESADAASSSNSASKKSKKSSGPALGFDELWKTLKYGASRIVRSKGHDINETPLSQLLANRAPGVRTEAEEREQRMKRRARRKAKRRARRAAKRHLNGGGDGDGDIEMAANDDDSGSSEEGASSMSDSSEDDEIPLLRRQRNAIIAAKEQEELERKRKLSEMFFKPDLTLERSQRSRRSVKRFSDMQVTETGKKRAKRQWVHDDYCLLCEEGGEMLMCYYCPRVYHLECLGLTEVPTGHFRCAWHSCLGCGASATDVGGVLLRCMTCCVAYCHGCIPPNARRIQPPARFMKHMGRVFPVKNLVFFQCEECKEVHEAKRIKRQQERKRRLRKAQRLEQLQDAPDSPSKDSAAYQQALHEYVQAMKKHTETRNMWERHQGDGDEGVYYHNLVTGVSQYNMPDHWTKPVRPRRQDFLGGKVNTKVEADAGASSSAAAAKAEPSNGSSAIVIDHSGAETTASSDDDDEDMEKPAAVDMHSAAADSNGMVTNMPPQMMSDYVAEMQALSGKMDLPEFDLRSELLDRPALWRAVSFVGHALVNRVLSSDAPTNPPSSAQAVTPAGPLSVSLYAPEGATWVPSYVCVQLSQASVFVSFCNDHQCVEVSTVPGEPRQTRDAERLPHSEWVRACFLACVLGHSIHNLKSITLASAQPAVQLPPLLQQLPAGALLPLVVATVVHRSTSQSPLLRHLVGVLESLDQYVRSKNCDEQAVVATLLQDLRTLVDGLPTAAQRRQQPPFTRTQQAAAAHALDAAWPFPEGNIWENSQLGLPSAEEFERLQEELRVERWMLELLLRRRRVTRMSDGMAAMQWTAGVFASLEGLGNICYA